MELERDIEEIRDAARTGLMETAADVSQGIVLRLLQSLGWPTFDTRTVRPQYGLEKSRVDFALCHPPGRPVVFIKVTRKHIGQGGGAERQLFEHAFHTEVRLVILTDGREWHFFLPFLPGQRRGYEERRICKLDIVERQIDECAQRLSRYLKYDDMRSGRAIEAAREDYRDASRKRQIEKTLRQAWMQLVAEEDDILLELLADKVKSLCGYKPDPDTIARFLKKSSASFVPTLPPPTPAPPEGGESKAPGFTFEGKRHPAHSAMDVLVSLLEKLTEHDPSFPERFARLPTHGRTRRYLARDREALYPGRPDLARDCSRRLESGWWVGTNFSRAGIRRIIGMACDVAGIRYDDLHVELGG